MYTSVKGQIGKRLSNWKAHHAPQAQFGLHQVVIFRTGQNGGACQPCETGIALNMIKMQMSVQDMGQLQSFPLQTSCDLLRFSPWINNNRACTVM